MEMNFDMYSGWFNSNIAWGDISTSICYDGLGLNRDGAIVDDSPWMQKYNNNGGPSFTGIDPQNVGSIENRHWEHIPISFYNSWAEESKFVLNCIGNGYLNPYSPSVTTRPFLYDDESRVTAFYFLRGDEEKYFFEVRHPHDTLWAHGVRWNSKSFTFPRDIAHPVLNGSRNLPRDFSVGVARPHISCFEMRYDKTKNLKHYILESGPISLTHFYDGCINVNWPINLYQFTPEWNAQFPSEYTHKTMQSVILYSNNTITANQFRAVDHVRGDHSLPMEINSEFPNNMVVPWLQDVSRMFANSGCNNYRHRIEIPSFISNVSGMFSNSSIYTFINQQNFNFDFNYNTVVYRRLESDGGLHWDYYPLMLDMSYMFANQGTSSAYLRYSDDFVYNNNIPDKNVVLPKRTINTSGMFTNTVYNFNIHLDSNIVNNTSKMFALDYGFNGNVNWYNAMATDAVVTGTGKINDASNMFHVTPNQNRPTWLPANGVNNACNMYSYVSNYISNEVTEFIIKPAPDADLTGEFIIGMDYNYETNVITVLKDLYSTEGDHNMYIPSGIQDSSSMFMGSHIKKGYGLHINSDSCYNAAYMFHQTYTIMNNIYVGDDCANANCHAMFSRSIDIDLPDNGYIYIGKNSMLHEGNFTLSGVFQNDSRYGPLNCNIKYLTFDDGSGKSAASYFYRGLFNIDKMVINNAFLNSLTPSGTDFGHKNMFNGSNIFINQLTIINSFPSSSSSSGGTMAFQNHKGVDEDITRLDILGTNPQRAVYMFANSSYTFWRGINISSTSCINADGMFSDCTSMYLNRTTEGNGKVFDGNPDLTLNYTFRNCYNLYTDEVIYEMPTRAKSAVGMFYGANIWNVSGLESMNCPNMRHAFSRSTIMAPPDTITLHKSMSDMIYMFSYANVSKQINIYVPEPEDYHTNYCDGAFIAMIPSPKEIYFENLYNRILGWNPIYSVEGGGSTEIILGENSPVDANHFFKYTRENMSQAQSLLIDIGTGTNYQWIVDDPSQPATEGHWEVISSGNNIPLNGNQYSLTNYYVRIDGYLYKAGYQEKYDYYDDGTYNYPTKMSIFTGKHFKNLSYNVNVTWLGDYPR